MEKADWIVFAWKMQTFIAAFDAIHNQQPTLLFWSVNELQEANQFAGWTRAMWEKYLDIKISPDPFSCLAVANRHHILTENDTFRRS